MDFLLDEVTAGCVAASSGSCMVNVPAAERFAVHKLVVFVERNRSERTKANKDIAQVAALASWFVERGDPAAFNTAWRELLARGRGWKHRALTGKSALLKMAPDLEVGTLANGEPPSPLTYCSRAVCRCRRTGRARATHRSSFDDAMVGSLSRIRLSRAATTVAAPTAFAD